MNTINFSHRYCKLPVNCTKARLMDVLKMDWKDLSGIFIDYDTAYVVGTKVEHYPLPKAVLLLLVLMTEQGALFTTLRRAYAEKEEYYRKGIGAWFNVKVADVGDKE